MHGSASIDVTGQEFFSSRNEGRENANAVAVETLLKNNVEFYLCGQSAAYSDIGKNDLLPGVKLALSAMTTHAMLAQDGFSLNPF